ncbi:hypothetical protein P4V43_13750 [Brevibacillus fortis]|uniref:hypothetical protein n=1 Tax=Brevibacillus TaxID=55080 RepID=UPI00156AC005|nr:MULTISPECIES: hypothetical protein [Brevibacillus]MED1782881.1 hypothetical protein [Brevibacillus fortis]UED73388.1 hypothetical protein HP399_022010 [Brevibacillus sp. DP1.3A]
MEQISIEKLMELFVDTIGKCGVYLLFENDEVIEYNIFEEFDTGVISFLHADNLQKLNDAGLISDEIMQKSTILRNWVQTIQQGNNWNVNAVRNSSEWKNILELADEIKIMLGQNF